MNNSGFGSIKCVVKISSDFSLAVYRHVLAIGETGEIDMTKIAVKGDVEAGMHFAFGLQSLVDIRLAQQINKALFEHPGPNSAQHVLA